MPKDAALEKQYNTLKDTFTSFDADGSGQLGYSEFKEAWKFIGRPGREEDIKSVYDLIDTDQSGSIILDEFVVTLMPGDTALQFGPLADIEVFNDLLQELKDDLTDMRG